MGSGLPQSEEAAAEVAALREECTLLRARADSNPEVTRFAGEHTCHFTQSLRHVVASSQPCLLMWLEMGPVRMAVPCRACCTHCHACHALCGPRCEASWPRCIGTRAASNPAGRAIKASL